MKSFRWTFVAAVIAVVCLSSKAVNAQLAYHPGAGMTEVSLSNPMSPASAGEMPTAGQSMSAAPQYFGGGYEASCDPGCGGGCGAGGNCGWGCGGDPAWHAYGDFLYLRARNEGMEFAMPVDPTTLTQTGETSVMNGEFQPGFRVGASCVVGSSSEIAVAYTYFRGDSSMGAAATGRSVLQPLVFSPFTSDADPTNPLNLAWTTGGAHEFTTFQYADVDFRHSLWSSDCSCLNYLVGVRYASLGQEFDASFMDANANVAAMQTNVNFDGVGLRLGLEGEHSLSGGFYTSAKAVANLVGGEFRATYIQGNAFNPLELNTNWREARFVGILEAEVAIGWQSSGGHFRASAGYMLTDWENAVKPSDYVTAVQGNPVVSNPFHGANLVGTTALVFDGLTGHVELVW